MILLFDIVIVLLLAILLISQVISPLLNGTLLFPAFRSKRRRLMEELRRANEEETIAQLQKELKHKLEVLKKHQRQQEEQKNGVRNGHTQQSQGDKGSSGDCGDSDPGDCDCGGGRGPGAERKDD